jgi:hypothetical protein
MTIFPNWLFSVLALALTQTARPLDELATPTVRREPQRQPVLAASSSGASDLTRLSVPELLARMPSDPWDRTTKSTWKLKPEIAELRRRVDARLFSDDDWRAALVASDAIHTRSRWVSGEPLYLWIREPAWLAHSKITARAIEPDLGSVYADNRVPSWCGNCRMSELDRQRQLALASMPRNTTEVVLEIAIELAAHRGPGNPSWEDAVLMWRGRLALPIESVATVDDVLSPTSDRGVEDAVRTSLRTFTSVQPVGSKPKLCVTAGGELTKFPALRGVGVSLTIELWNQGTLVESRDMLVSQAVGFFSHDGGATGFVAFTSVPSELFENGAGVAGWEFHVIGKPDHLLHVWEAEKYWSGSFTVPLEQTK